MFVRHKIEADIKVLELFRDVKNQFGIASHKHIESLNIHVRNAKGF